MMTITAQARVLLSPDTPKYVHTEFISNQKVILQGTHPS